MNRVDILLGSICATVTLLPQVLKWDDIKNVVSDQNLAASESGRKRGVGERGERKRKGGRK